MKCFIAPMFVASTVFLAACGSTHTVGDPPLAGGAITNAVVVSGRSFNPVVTLTTLVATNANGTVLVSAKPRFWFSELGCQILMDGNGNTLPNMFTLLTFEIEGKQQTTIWSSRTSRRDVVFHASKEYRFLIRPAPSQNAYCTILKVWDGLNVLYDASQPER